MTPARHPRVVALLATVLALLTLLLPQTSGPATAATPPSSAAVPGPDPGHPWFGPGLDWAEDLPHDYADRLGASPSLYAQRVRYPLAEDDRTYLEQFAQQAATQGAVAVLTLEPQAALDDLTVDQARELGSELARMHRELDTVFLVRFAPEMNGSWVTWGQQPEEYVDAFRVVADAVHDRTSHAAMVWAPSYGAGYPFGRAYGAVDPSGTRPQDQLDTDANGRVDDADDPYGPYYPGDAYVDWVGLSLYRFSDEEHAGGNVVPQDGEYEQRLDETWGYAAPARRTPFYERYAESRDRPLLVETSALYDPSDGDDDDQDGADELDLKRTWWRQVLASVADHPLVAAISWLELERPEAEIDDRVADWRATHTEELAGALHRDLERSPVALGPVTHVLDQQVANEATAQGRLPDADEAGDEMGWIVLCAALLAVAFVLAGAAGRWLPSWRYPDEHDPRDRRLDLFRGWIILTVVITHIEVASPYSFISLNAIGAITGAEMFVLLSGIVLGMVYEPTVRKLGEWATAITMWRRARKQYLVALVVIVLVFLLGLVPLVDAAVITTFTDRGTGENGDAVAGQVYDLYANAPRLFDYPPPWYAVQQLLLLEMGPWVFNIMGLFVVLSLLLPILMWFLRRGLWWLVLAVSWALFVYQAIHHPRPIPSQFEDVFPLLTWQIAFTHGLVVGYHRRRITQALTTRTGRIGCTVFVVGYAAALVYLWATHHWAMPSSPFPASSYDYLYQHGYTRVFLQPGRLLDLVLMVVVSFAVLTTMWKPINAAVGWLWIPLGQASLYVFTVHVFLVLAVGNIPGLDRGSVWQGTLVHTAAILLIWVMVRRRFLFSVIPR